MIEDDGALTHLVIPAPLTISVDRKRSFVFRSDMPITPADVSLRPIVAFRCR
jgi:hypothetical protein